MLRYSDEFYSKKFTGKNTKEAYLKACKWYATNVIAKDELRNVYIEYEKRDEQSPTIVIHLYASLIEEEVRANHCAICREAHKSLFLGEETNCAWCKVKGYQNRMDEHMTIKKSYYARLLERSDYGE